MVAEASKLDVAVQPVLISKDVVVLDEDDSLKKDVAVLNVVQVLDMLVIIFQSTMAASMQTVRFTRLVNYHLYHVQFVIEAVKQGFTIHGYHAETATHVTAQLEARYGFSWHCVLAKHLKANVRCEGDRYLSLIVEGYEFVILSALRRQLDSSPSVKIVSSTVNSSRDEVV